MTSLCDRLVTCDTDPNKANDAMEKLECTQEFTAGIGCDRAQGVGMTYDQCVSDISLVSCVTLSAALPQSCVGALDIAPSQGETQCVDLVGSLCRRLIECDPAVDVTQAECVEVLTEDPDVGFRCSEVASVAATYPTCIQQLSTLTCAELLPPPEMSLDLPMSCVGVLLTTGDGGGGGGGTNPPPIDPGGGGGLGL